MPEHPQLPASVPFPIWVWPEESPRANDYRELTPTKLGRAVTPFWHWSFSTWEETRHACLAFLNRETRRNLPRWQLRKARHRAPPPSAASAYSKQNAGEKM